jgi:histidyl-tRNA synthetase
MPAFQTPRGLRDLLPPRSEEFERVIRESEDLFRRFGYRRIETPAFEYSEVFERGLEETSEMIVKETYKFKDRAGRSMTLRPDGTTPVMRAVLQHNLTRTGAPVKLYYTAPMFRYEKPQAHRYRQHTQLGVEAVGSDSPSVDAEVIRLGAAVYDNVGLPAPLLRLNSIGHPGCRADYLPKLGEFLEKNRERLCADCQRKIESNPLRTFDCKVPQDQEIMASAPLISDYLCDECRSHFAAVQDDLKELGVAFELDPRLVRGLDYYTRTTFEFEAAGMGAQSSVGGGGRYDGLAELLGGAHLPGIGFGLGVDRIIEALERSGHEATEFLDVFVVSVGEDAARRALLLTEEVRRAGISADLDFEGKAVKSQFRTANRRGARLVVVIGERELAEGMLTVRDMTTGDESTVPADELITFLQGKAALREDAH